MDLNEASLPELLTVALARANGQETKGTRRKHETTAAEVAMDLLPSGVMLYASKAQRGPWWYYLVLPYGQCPRVIHGWMLNESGGYFWKTDSGTTEHEALTKGLIAYFADTIAALPVEAG